MSFGLSYRAETDGREKMTETTLRVLSRLAKPRRKTGCATRAAAVLLCLLVLLIQLPASCLARGRVFGAMFHPPVGAGHFPRLDYWRHDRRAPPVGMGAFHRAGERRTFDRHPPDRRRNRGAELRPKRDAARPLKHAPRPTRSPAVALPSPVSAWSRLSAAPHRVQRRSEAQALPRYVPRQILVLFDQDQPQAVGDELARTYDMHRLSTRPIRLLGARAELMQLRKGRSVTSTLAALQRDGRVRSAQLNQLYFHTGPSDQKQFRLEGVGQHYSNEVDRRDQSTAILQYGARKVGLPAAHQLALGRNVGIAVIDSYVDTAHPELRGALVRSFNAAGPPDTASDFHGTAVAGILCAHGVIESVAPEAQILAVRAFHTGGRDAFPETTTHILMTAVDWAIKNGAKILNMSFIGSHDAALEQLMTAAIQKGIVVVAAAGNGGPTAPPAYPAAYRGVIAVTAVDEADSRYEHANRGSYIAVAAPGVDILAPVERAGYAYVSGTSFAAAYVSGIAALLLERDPDLDPKAVADLIETGADHLGASGRNDDFGAGRVNADASLKLLDDVVSANR